MKKELLASFSDKELKAYVNVLGIEVDDDLPVQEKIDLIEEARNRTAVINVMGLDVSVPIKRLHDKRITDKIDALESLGGVQVQQLFEDIVGKEQMKKIVKYVTDDDGTVDVDALGVFVARVLTDESLKNY